ncbi:GNAT family N-acetyltransferase [Aureibacter tunicatorum]|uniref:RimJ/RimL family protein N-acetyltransferase n=1 Tax=Aureibacter tunicatorum TaxID=866807 RepID=A0AAE3XP62_9BACT|nr:GNAT family N-acetyltransferase [Aureibacter tunicatorum]MDR6239371.1 RimJ/RimL family protein N-acetyltransferase [Aureibacter tunicatorum]BDD04706.1 hypothetical protein AUTU_21890 [Aureibacter tunicatorum]
MIIETKRLILRELNVGDARDFYDLNEDKEVLKYTGDVGFQDVEEAKTFLSGYSDYKKNGYGRWAVVLKESGRFLGWCGLKLNEEGLVDLGYRFFRNEWGKGYATESAIASLNYGFENLDLDDVIARSDRNNVASIKVIEKLGMEFWKNDECKGISNAVYYRIDKQSYIEKVIR